MRILGVDPGTLIAGYGCLDLQAARGGQTGAMDAIDVPVAHRASNFVAGAKATGRPTVVAFGALRLGSSKDPVPQRLGRLAADIARLFAELEPDELALEEAYFGKSVQSALRIGEARGVILAEASRAGVRISQYAPARIKRSVTGRGAASKELVAQLVAQTLRMSGVPTPLDVTDALAVGLCCAEEKRSFRLGAG